jgi:hypothetical protein
MGKAAGRSRKPGPTKNIVIHLDQLFASGKRAIRGALRKASQTSEGVLVTGTSAGGAAIAITLAAVAARRNGVKSIVFSYNTLPTGGRLTITDNAVTVFDIDVPAAGQFQIPLPDGVQNLAVNTALVATLAGGGGAVVGKINLSAVLV